MRNPKPYTFLRAVGRVFKERPLLFVGTFVLILVTVVAALLPPLVLERAVNALTEKREVSLQLAFLYFLLIACSGAFESFENVMITRFGQSIMHSLRTDMKEKLHRLPANYFIVHSAGEIDSRFVNDVEAVDTLFTDGIISMFADACKVISILIVIFNRSVGVGGLILLVTPLLMAITRQFQRLMLKAQLDNRKAIARVNGHIPETISNMRMITSFHAAKFMEKRYDDYIDESYEATDRSNLYNSIYSPIITVLRSAVIAIMMICAVSPSMKSIFGISVGSAVAMISYVSKIFSPLEGIGTEIQSIQSAIAGVKRIHEFMNSPERGLPNESNRPTDTDPLIQFDHVTFGYLKDRTILKDLSFAIHPEEAVTFVGRTGSGKSTIFRLLLGLYTPQEGSIQVSGLTPTELPDSAKRNLFGYVEQSFHAIQGNVRDQISLQDPDVTEEEIQNAVDLVGIADLIESLPQGYDTPFEQCSLSEGQLQLLSIARAIVKDPCILLLDEITASLDSATEAKLLAALQSASAGRTTISISHRLNEAVHETRTIEISPLLNEA